VSARLKKGARVASVHSDNVYGTVAEQKDDDTVLVLWDGYEKPEPTAMESLRLAGDE
jgi:hypothetical protein